jgi:hypothetical protein
MNRLSLAAAAILFVSAPAMAEDRLTVDTIQTFLNDTTALTHQDSALTDADVTAYLDLHLSNNGTYASSVLYEVPGNPATPKDFTLNKQQFIDNVVSGRKQMKNYESSVKLYTHTIAGDGKSADIETITNERGEMPINPEETMPFEGTTVCKQALKMEGQTIVLTRADCEARIGFIE